MSDDPGGYRREVGDEGDQDDAELGPDDPGGWPQDEPDAGESQSVWPDPGSTWQRPAYGEAPRDWERPDYGDSGYTRSDDLLSGDDRAEPYEENSRDPLARLFPGLPRSVRVTLDWIL